MQFHGRKRPKLSFKRNVNKTKTKSKITDALRCKLNSDKKTTKKTTKEYSITTICTSKLWQVYDELKLNTSSSNGKPATLSNDKPTLSLKLGSSKKEVQDELVFRYSRYASNLFKSFIATKMRKVSYSLVDSSDLESASNLGLIEAVTKFNVDNPSSATFETFSYPIIIGRMIDCLRALQNVTRFTAGVRREFRGKIQELSHKLGKKLNDDELLEHVTEGNDYSRNFNVNVFNSMEINPDTYTYCSTCECDRFFDSQVIESKIMRLLRMLPDNETKNYSMIIYCYYYLQLNTKAIADILDCSLTLVTKYKHEALQMLRPLVDREWFEYE